MGFGGRGPRGTRELWRRNGGRNKGNEGGRGREKQGKLERLCSVEWWFERFPAVEADGSISWTSSVFLISYVIVINWFFFQVGGACEWSEGRRQRGRRSTAILRVEWYSQNCPAARLKP